MVIDEVEGTLVLERDGIAKSLPLYSDAAFEAIARQYVRVGWNQKHTYTFSWMGRPIIQFPDDLLRLQEIVYGVRPDLVVETGVAHGGSLMFYASLMEAMDHGRVLGIDIDIRPHNRAAIEAHPLFRRIQLLEGSSTSGEIIALVRKAAAAAERVLVVLDSDHSRAHVTEELNAYADLVTPGSYIVAADGIMRDLAGVPRADPGWRTDNPASAVEAWLPNHPEFELVQPAWPFNESTLSRNVTHFPSAFLRRRSA